MTDKRVLAIDLDGTLLVGESLSDRNRDAVRRANDAGHGVIIATARWRQMAERIADEIGLADAPLIACSGAQVYCRSREEDIYDERLPAGFVEELYAICNDSYCIATATLDDHTWLKMDKEPAPQYLSEELRWIDRLPLADSLPRIATVQSTAAIKAVRQLHETKYLEDVNIYDSIGPSGKTVITITARRADKGQALKSALAYLNATPDQVIAFGDAHNDIRMFELAGRSVAMGQASDDVKAHASTVTASNEDDGVAQYIEENLL